MRKSRRRRPTSRLEAAFDAIGSRNVCRVQPVRLMTRGRRGCYANTQEKDARSVAVEIKAKTFAEAVQTALELDAPLNERLGMVADALQHFAPDQAEIVERLV